MKRPYRYDQLSDRTCNCGRRLKLNVLARQPRAVLCYKCWKARKKVARRGELI